MTHPFLQNLLNRQVRCDRTPALLQQLDLLKWAEGRVGVEPHPDALTIAEAECYALLRTEPGWEALSDEELRSLLEANPMLPAEIGAERMLEHCMAQAASKPPTPLQKSQRGIDLAGGPKSTPTTLPLWKRSFR